jgi:hypothetical protein
MNIVNAAGRFEAYFVRQIPKQHHYYKSSGDILALLEIE